MKRVLSRLHSSGPTWPSLTPLCLPFVFLSFPGYAQCLEDRTKNKNRRDRRKTTKCFHNYADNPCRRPVKAAKKKSTAKKDWGPRKSGQLIVAHSLHTINVGTTGLSPRKKIPGTVDLWRDQGTGGAGEAAVCASATFCSSEDSR